MTVVEHDFLDESEHNEFKDDPVKRRQFAAEAASSPLHHDERQIHERNADDCLIDDHRHNDVSQLHTINLRRHHSASRWYSSICYHQGGFSSKSLGQTTDSMSQSLTHNDRRLVTGRSPIPHPMPAVRCSVLPHSCVRPLVSEEIGRAYFPVLFSPDNTKLIQGNAPSFL